MVTMLETILNGMSLILGTEVIVFLLLTFSFLAFLFSRGLGITSLLSTLILSAYLFSSETISDVNYLQYDYFIFIIMIVGLFLGILVYNYFIRD